MGFWRNRKKTKADGPERQSERRRSFLEFASESSVQTWVGAHITREFPRLVWGVVWSDYIGNLNIFALPNSSQTPLNSWESQPEAVFQYMQMLGSQGGQHVGFFSTRAPGKPPSGAGVFFLLNDAFTDQTKIDFAKRFLMPIGAFGFVVTLGLFFYELHGIKKCDHLIKVGKKIEGLLGIEGQFTNRPGKVNLFHTKLFINEPITARVIYPAVLAAWTFAALVFALPRAAALVAILVFTVGFYIPSRLNLKADNSSTCK